MKRWMHILASLWRRMLLIGRPPNSIPHFSHQTQRGTKTIGVQEIQNCAERPAFRTKQTGGVANESQSGTSHRFPPVISIVVSILNSTSKTRFRMPDRV